MGSDSSNSVSSYNSNYISIGAIQSLIPSEGMYPVGTIEMATTNSVSDNNSVTSGTATAVATRRQEENVAGR